MKTNRKPESRDTLATIVTPFLLVALGLVVAYGTGLVALGAGVAVGGLVAMYLLP